MALKFVNIKTGVTKTAVFCFTGKCPKTRPEMQDIAIKAGGQVTASVNRRTTILVIADANSMSSKAMSARDRGIDLISPKQFFLMCDPILSTNGSYNTSQVHIEKPKPKPNEKRKHSSVRRIQL